MFSLPASMSDRDGLGRQLVTSVAGSSTVRAIGLVFNFLVGVQLVRYLGPADFGIYGTVMAIAAILVVPAELGLPQLITRELAVGLSQGDYARARGSLVWFTRAVLVASLVMVPLGALGYILFADLTGYTPAAAGDTHDTFFWVYFWGLATIPVTALMGLGRGVLRGYHKVISAQLYESLVRPALIACLLFAVAAFAGQVDATIAMMLQFGTGLIALVAYAVHIARTTPTVIHSAETARMGRNWAGSAIPMMGTEILRTVDGQYPVLLLGLLAPIGDVGVFRAALAISAFVGMPSTLITLVIMPYVAQLHAEGQTAKIQMIATLSAGTMFVSIGAITLVFGIFGEHLLAFLFGEAFIPAWFPLVLIGIAWAINGFFGSATTMLNMGGQERSVTLVYAVGPVVGGALTVLLYPHFGISAAAVAMIVCELIKGVWMTITARRTLGVDVSLFSFASVLNQNAKFGGEP